MFLVNASKVLRVAAVVVVLTSCGGGDGGDSGSPQASPPPAGNSAPTIQGTPSTSVLAGQQYNFQPVASDPNGDALRFTASNLPDWMSLDPATGRLTGRPTMVDIGSFENITISVSDGSLQASLRAFSITVVASGTGQATVSWLAPTQNTDGSALTDLASYRIYYGTAADDLSLSLAVDNPSLSTFVIEGLTSGPWYFAVVAINAAGVGSSLSDIASKTIS